MQFHQSLQTLLQQHIQGMGGMQRRRYPLSDEAVPLFCRVLRPQHGRQQGARVRAMQGCAQHHGHGALSRPQVAGSG